MSSRLNRGERTERIAKGLCPKCGREAAPYLLCSSCRLLPRITRAVERGVRHGVLSKSLDARYTLNRSATQKSHDDWEKWATPINLPATDGRGKPRVRGVRVNIEDTLLNVVRWIGRPCTVEEIMAAWGKLRGKRSDPLAGDLGRLIVADAKRARKMAKRAEIVARL